MKPNHRELIVFAVTAAGLLLAYHWIFSAFFPAANNGIGHDYSYFLPNLLDGYYWYLNNGALSTPWFTAAFCGGVPAFPNPQNIYFSVPQWLSFAADPLSAVYITMLLFALTGFAGFYVLLRRCFQVTPTTALLAAALFMFNGFFAHRLLIGHLGMHVFMLTPVIAYLLLDRADRQAGDILRTAMAGLLFAYVIYAGGTQLILPMIIAVMIIGLTQGLLHQGQACFWMRLAGGGALGMLLALAKLSAALAFLDNFQRSDYQLPGVESIWGLVRLSFETLFLHPADTTIRAFWSNAQWATSRHEFEYGITVVPLIMLVIAVPFLLGRVRGKARLSARQWLQLGALFLLLLMPLALNYYTPAWNAFLKDIPVIRSSSTLIRWFSIYIPVILLGAGLAFDKAAGLKRVRPYLAAGGILAVVVVNAMTERDYYATQPYNPAPITTAYEQARGQGHAPRIDKITAFRDQHGRILMPIFRNNSLVQGASQLFCYEPIFGYRLEKFPVQQMRPGPVSAVINDHFNLKNPACYVYDESNNCAPGDHFAVSQAQAAQAFSRYQAYPFQLPWWQRAANMISLVTLALIVLFLPAYAVMSFRNKRAANKPSGY